MAAVADLSGVRLKLGRPEEHLSTLKTEVDARTEQHSDRSLIDVRRDGDWHVVEIEPPPSIPRRWALIGGDLIHNLRSVLDHLVWQLVLRDGQQPSRWNEFPIIDSEQRFLQEVKFRKRNPDRSPLQGIRVDGDAWAIIEAAQPYKRPKPHTLRFSGENGCTSAGRSRRSRT